MKEENQIKLSVQVESENSLGPLQEKLFFGSRSMHWNETWRVTSQQLAEGYPRSTNSGGCRGTEAIGHLMAPAKTRSTFGAAAPYVGVGVTEVILGK
ncbi:hypothetical protein NPIL_30201 [Nephila pilipes]|uniref:Uncharacterized protein n=1 Tax=Nephila pilipes TaxID=299642 RepID=A0A8X6QKV8_NEPPI|nr:hypothetical protein NPIL_30201 [Nephila pilipes]